MQPDILKGDSYTVGVQGPGKGDTYMMGTHIHGSTRKTSILVPGQRFKFLSHVKNRSSFWEGAGSAHTPSTCKLENMHTRRTQEFLRLLGELGHAVHTHT